MAWRSVRAIACTIVGDRGRILARSLRLSMNVITSSSVAIDTTGMPNVSRTSCTADDSPWPRSMRSSAISTPAGLAPAAPISSTDSRIDVPAVMTSSTITTRPRSGAPTTVPPSP